MTPVMREAPAMTGWLSKTAQRPDEDLDYAVVGPSEAILDIGMSP